VNEIEALKTIDDALTALADQDARKRILTWACGKFLQQAAPTPVGVPHAALKEHTKNRSKERTAPKQRAAPVALVKDLNLKPKDKQSLDAFVLSKKPQSLYEKCTLSVYYLKNELSLSSISVSHVYTCFKHMKWKLPSDIANTLSYTASHYGWLDTSNKQDLRVTAIGENLIEHDLPRKKKS
jgi:hypothetical protein